MHESAPSSCSECANPAGVNYDTSTWVKRFAATTTKCALRQRCIRVVGDASKEHTSSRHASGNMSNLFARGDFMRLQFDELDRDRDGFITEADLKASVQGHQVHSCAINCFFKRYDKDGDRKISFEEYRNGLLAYLFQNLQNEDMARSLFGFLDTDKSGSVSTKELYSFFEGCIGCLPKEYVTDFLNGLDENKDGEISEAEFLAFVKKNRAKQCAGCAASQQSFVPSSMR
ncbi:unnamed protein product [Mesocestoides corti]|uniref:EF-hand domain-containing protein n=2 Tax=Mesocestoides corti TaxID=53468 RepID=A0A0R3UQU6_MESCO|nr:unnamed protein product [Mesocestoides corti]